MNTAPKTGFTNKITRVLERKQELEKTLEDPAILTNPEKLANITREHNHLMAVSEKILTYQDLLRRVEDDEKILNTTDDAELKNMAKEVLDENNELIVGLEKEIQTMLIPKDPRDEKNAIMEIRAGTGGHEAALFAGDIYRMYLKYIEHHAWKREILSSNPTELGGFKEIIFSISGDNVYGRLKYESGVHRVQRVPVTETGGRIHTSAASVVVLPEAKDVDIKIEANDLRIDVFRSSGPGGQSVNTTDSAVRITHVPTGIVVTCQDEKSQHKNKSKALRVLRARLFDLKRKEEDAKIAASRRSMIGSGDRSMKIRTYNFPQGRITDHRINLTLYKLQEVLGGDLDEVINKLQSADRDEILNRE